MNLTPSCPKKVTCCFCCRFILLCSLPTPAATLQCAIKTGGGGSGSGDLALPSFLSANCSPLSVLIWFFSLVSGQVRSAIGLAHLLVNQRFKQFSGLIKDCDDGKTPKVTPQDLEGFWEMVYFQVEDIYNKFQKLDSIKDEILPPPL